MAEKQPKLGEEQEAAVEKYAPRPYVEALSDDHRKVLAEADQLPAEPQSDGK